jgi:hypothetical protein
VTKTSNLSKLVKIFRKKPKKRATLFILRGNKKGGLEDSKIPLCRLWLPFQKLEALGI